MTSQDLNRQSVTRPSSGPRLEWFRRLLRRLRPSLSNVLFQDPRAHTWARRIHALDEVPPIYLPFFRARDSDGPFPYAVLAPTYGGGHGRPQPERLLCIADQSVHVIELVNGALTDRCYSPDVTVLIERGLFLLHSWITLRSLCDGEVQSTTVRFNSISEELMQPFVEALRPCPIEGVAADLHLERSRFDFLAPTHYKFMSYACRSLRPGDHVRQLAFAPEFFANASGLKRLAFWRPVTPTLLTILTETEVIQIRDEPGARWSRRPPSGAIWTYAPRASVRNVSLVQDRQALSLTLELADGSCLQQHADPAHAQDLHLLSADLTTQRDR